MWDAIRGQERSLPRLVTSVQTNPTPVLISGPSGVGKRLAAIQAARWLLCRGTKQGTCNCKSCLLFSKNAHPDFLTLSGRSGSVGVAEVRSLVETLQSYPALGVYVVFLDCLEGFTLASQNGLLKTIEEHPKTVRFLATTSNVLEVVPAILSRCSVISFDSLPLEVVASKMASVEKSPPLVDLYSRMAEGSLGRAMILWKNNQVVVRDGCFELLEWLVKRDYYSILGAIDGDRAPDQILWLGQILSDGCLPSPRIHVDSAERIARLSSSLDFPSLWFSYRELVSKIAQAPSLHVANHLKGFFLAYSH